MLMHVPTTDLPATAILHLDIVSDAICPWCYVAKRRIERAAKICAVDGLAIDVHWRAYELNPDMPAEGLDRKSYRSAKFGSWEKSQQLDAQVAGQAIGEGLHFDHDLMLRTPNTRAAHRLIALAYRDGGASLQDAVVEAIFAAYFTEGRDIGDIVVLETIARACGVQAATTEGLHDSGGLQTVLADEDRGRAAGLTGVPSVLASTFFLFSGAQPVDDIVRAFKASHAQMTDDTRAGIFQ
ncbi:DsbA family oxidoreductase [uncultured Roseobacter sp.]|uniref:DsbA family oxidoreductase n=1 Tax=uncultured Roseobacter sp. TaxID=114847 RepID=UPI0026155AD3|nr:DsbA family oxidoreductase [uncultured Roseobacter sp.]